MYDLIEKYGFTTQEAIVFEWQFSMMGDFQRSLMTTITLADEENLKKIAQGFPHHVEAFKGWSRGGLWDRLKIKMDNNPEVFERFRI